MQRLVHAGTPIGVLAYDGDEPIGWCSVAPRETFVRLERSRTMPRVTPPATPTWIILCFFVKRSRREQGVTHLLVEGVVAYAKQHGATVVEGYPFDTAGISSTHRGHSRVFESGAVPTSWEALVSARPALAPAGLPREDPPPAGRLRPGCRPRAPSFDFWVRRQEDPP